MKTDIKQAYNFSFHNRKSVEKSSQCGCFYCLKIFPSSDVVNYIDNDDTALCPHCKNDSIISDEDIKLHQNLLKQMKNYWFYD